MCEPETQTDVAHQRFSLKPKNYRCGLKIALVQLAVGADKCKNLESAVHWIGKAKEQGAELVALPECFNSPYGTSLKIALVQLAVGADKCKNLESAVHWIGKAKEQGAELVALPECFNSPYGTKYFDEYAEEIPKGETSRALSDAAKKHDVCVVGGTFPERCNGKLFNTCTVWGSAGQLIAKHRKMHLFDIDIPGKMTFKESEVLSPGDDVTTFECNGVKVGLGICYDLRFPELSHLMAKEGCSLLIYPGAFNMTTGPKHWELLGRARANDNQLFMALVSPARDEGASYVAWGHTMLVDPWAGVCQHLDEKEGMIVADIDLRQVEEVRTQIPIRSQRRTDVYNVIRHHKVCSK